MARLYRPHIPLRVQCAVAMRQLDRVVMLAPSAKKLLEILQADLAKKFGCDVKELRLDHDPPLGARKKRGEGKMTVYSPAANDPAHLFYRPHGPQHERSHLIKTNVRGDHGQHPDRVLIKKQRRIERGPKPKRGPKIKSRGFAKASRPFPKRREHRG